MDVRRENGGRWVIGASRGESRRDEVDAWVEEGLGCTLSSSSSSWYVCICAVCDEQGMY